MLVNFGLKNFSLLLFYIQLHGLIWLQCYNFYPSEWRIRWRWTLLFLLDFHNFIKDSGINSDGVDQLGHSIIIILFFIFMGLLYRYLLLNVYSSRQAGGLGTDQHRLSYLNFQRYSIVIGEFLLIPILLLLFRTWTCNLNNELIYIYPKIGCWSGPHFVIAFIITIAASIVVGTFIYKGIYQKIKKIVVFKEELEHEKVKI